MQYCPSCGKSIEDGVGFCPHCGKAVTSQTTAPAPAPAQDTSSPAAPPKVQTPLTAEQMKAADVGLAAAALNLLFWGTGYFRAKVAKPFGWNWIIFPLIYIVYVFVGHYLIFNFISEHESTLQVVIPNSGNLTTTITGPNPYPGLAIRDLEIFAFVVPGIIFGLFLARDVYRRSIASSGTDGAPSLVGAFSNWIGRAWNDLGVDAMKKDYAYAFSVVGGVLIVIGAFYLTVLDWLSFQTNLIGGIGELEGMVLGGFVIYLAVLSRSMTKWRVPFGVLIIGFALIALARTGGDLVDLAFAVAMVGGALTIAESE